MMTPQRRLNVSFFKGILFLLNTLPRHTLVLSPPPLPLRPGFPLQCSSVLGIIVTSGLTKLPALEVAPTQSTRANSLRRSLKFRLPPFSSVSETISLILSSHKSLLLWGAPLSGMKRFLALAFPYSPGGFLPGFPCRPSRRPCHQPRKVSFFPQLLVFSRKRLPC